MPLCRAQIGEFDSCPLPPSPGGAGWATIFTLAPHKLVRRVKKQQAGPYWPRTCRAVKRAKRTSPRVRADQEPGVAHETHSIFNPKNPRGPDVVPAARKVGELQTGGSCRQGNPVVHVPLYSYRQGPLAEQIKLLGPRECSA